MLSLLLLWLGMFVGDVFAEEWGKRKGSGGCKSGLVVEDGYCCWPGQGWGGSCIGDPECPSGLVASGYQCVEPGCPGGKVKVKGKCCWPGQVWSSSGGKCVGTPKCPQGRERVGNDCIRLYEEVGIPNGSFEMGCTSTSKLSYCDNEFASDEKPIHRVTISRSFYLMKSEVTQELYEKVMGENPSTFKGSRRPVEGVSWYEAARFANALSKLEGREECYQIGSGDSPSVRWSNKSCTGWRLPTEAEWEYAARGGQSYIYAGSNRLDDVAWTSENSSNQTHDVCLKSTNGFGLCDMSGNIREWCWDKYGAYSSSSKTDPRGVESSYRVFRGGSWWGSDWYARVSDRNRVVYFSGHATIGFRVLRVAD